MNRAYLAFGISPEPLQRIEHKRVYGIEKQVVVGEVAHVSMLAGPHKAVPSNICWVCAEMPRLPPRHRVVDQVGPPDARAAGKLACSQMHLAPDVAGWLELDAVTQALLRGGEEPVVIRVELEVATIPRGPLPSS